MVFFKVDGAKIKIIFETSKFLRYEMNNKPHKADESYGVRLQDVMYFQ